MSVEPGWYKDPADPSTQRYWDGEGWVGKPLPADATPPPGPPPIEPEPEPAPAPEPAPPPAPPGERRPAHPQEQRPAPPESTGGGRAAGTSAGSGPLQPGSLPRGPLQPGPLPPGSFPPGPLPPEYRFALPAPRPHGHPLAPVGARLAARLIDIGIVLMLNVAVNGWFVWQWFQEVQPVFAEAWRRSLAGDTSTEGMPQPDPRASNLALAILLITAALWFAYEVPSVANGGQTVGKRLAGVKVLSMAEDERVGFGRSLRRWNTLGLPVFLWYCCGAGLLLQLVDCGYALVDRPLRQALHDKRAQTVVVQVPRQFLSSAGRRGDRRAKTPGGSA